MIESTQGPTTHCFAIMVVVSIKTTSFVLYIRRLACIEPIVPYPTQAVWKNIYTIIDCIKFSDCRQFHPAFCHDMKGDTWTLNCRHTFLDENTSIWTQEFII